MESYPRSQAEFDLLFTSEEVSRRYIAALRWPDGFCCPHCGHGHAWITHGHALYICTHCGVQTSLTAGTIFQDTRQALQRWLRAIWYITNQKNGVSALGFQRAMGFGSYHTAWAWLHKLRRAMVRPGRDNLTGTVQIDETYFGGPRPGHRGRGADGKTLGLLAVEHEGKRIGRIRLCLAADPTPNTLEPLVQAMVAPGSLIETDGWGGYSGLTRLGFRHVVVRRTSIVGEDPLPQVHLVISLLKRWLLGTHQGAVQPTHLEYYFDEFTFRFNRRTSKYRGKLFYRLVQQAVQVDPVRESDLRANNTK
jgi:transposase-like protein